MNGDPTKSITQKSLLSIGLTIIFITSAFWGGYSLAEVRTELRKHEEKSIHPGAVSREAIELQLKLINQKLGEIEDKIEAIENGN